MAYEKFLPFEYLLEKWSRHFGVRKPGLKRRGRTRAYYRRQFDPIGRTGIILFPQYDLDTFLHEFTHHLAWSRFAVTGHGKVFRRCLWRIASHVYGDPGKYPWKEEYVRVKEYGLKRLENRGT